ncbi:AfsR/SARP family transcriptional regulator [Arthrobacter sp. Leaf337]|jgi:DNA-binding SARP family transcriptional activator|uniref:AfsR/SARP family transcriptional regulator n=1 Tax=Arthrobacter sp. Leaf337 TaxID=1736342 RepID=UPI00190FD771|nr:bacterial transcriptional activator domain-containing protein [Arthrobacter sp. Leaf337]
MPSPEVRLRLLEGFELTIDGQPLELPPSAERLVAFLALQLRPALRSHVAGLLWGDRDDGRAAGCLRSTIWRTNSGHAAPVIDASRSRIVLHGNVSVDARDAATAARAQLAGGPPVDPAMLTGELLPGWYEDWVLVERERLRQLCLEGMEQMAQTLLEDGQAHLAVEAALAVVAAEPLRESAHRVLIDAHFSMGNRVAALRQFDQCRALLAAELGLQPGEALAASAARAHGSAAITQAARRLLTGVEAAITPA